MNDGPLREDVDAFKARRVVVGLWIARVVETRQRAE